MEKAEYDLLLGNQWAKQSKAILNWDDELLSLEVEGESTIIPVTCTQQRSTMKLISLERELEEPVLDYDDEEYEFEEEELVD